MRWRSDLQQDNIAVPKIIGLLEELSGLLYPAALRFHASPSCQDRGVVWTYRMPCCEVLPSSLVMLQALLDSC